MGTAGEVGGEGLGLILDMPSYRWLITILSRFYPSKPPIILRDFEGS